MKLSFAKQIGQVLVLMLATVGLSAAVMKTFDYSYSPLDKEYYLTQQQIGIVRPGLNVTVADYAIAEDGTVTVNFTLTDDAGNPLDINGIFTPGPIRISFLIARIPEGSSTYVNYATNSSGQATSDSGGAITEIERGSYLYTFGLKLPAGYDRDATHSIGYYAERNLEEYFELGAPMDDGVITFVPSGGEVDVIREVVSNEACSSCHDFLRVHGRRHSVELCVLCHYPGVSDPDTGNTVDFPVMIHKIHAGEHLPSVQAGEPYQIIGYRQSVHDYSTVALPQDLRNCDTCHADSASQAAAYFLNPMSSACGACHDDVDFETGENHPAGAVTDDECVTCHLPEGEMEFDASILGAHTIPTESSQLSGVNINLLSASSMGPGTSPTVIFTVTNDAGEDIPLDELNRLRMLLAGPTTDYRMVVSENALNDAVLVGRSASPASSALQTEYSYTFEATLPEDAEGTYAIGTEGRQIAVLNPGTEDEMEVRDTAENPVIYFAVTGEEAEPRRVVVADALCESCHRNLSLHGDNRHNATAYCQFCHNPVEADAEERPADQMPPRSISFQFMIHRIHAGEELSRDFTVYGHNGSVNNFNEVRYPSRLGNCAKCHVDATYEQARGVLSTTTEREFFSPMPPTATACLGCHDSLPAAAHAFVSITPFGESCMSCHGPERDIAVAKVHAE